MFPDIHHEDGNKASDISDFANGALSAGADALGSLRGLPATKEVRPCEAFR